MTRASSFSFAIDPVSDQSMQITFTPHPLNCSLNVVFFVGSLSS